MTNKFPIGAMVKLAAVQVAAFKKGILITIGYFIGAVVIVLALMIAATGGDLSFLEPLLSGAQTVSAPAPGGFGFIFFLALVGFLVGYAWIFNMWIRFGAFGAEGAFFESPTVGLKAAAVTALKLIFIMILLAIVAIVAVLIFAAIGLIDLQSATNAATPTLSNALTTNLVALAVISGVYSLFSSNLTQTALGSDSEEVGPPHVFEFAVVLFILDALLVVPLVFMQVFAPMWMTAIFQLVGGVWITAAIPLAHGVRYDWQRQQFAGETAAEQFNLSDDADEDV